MNRRELLATAALCFGAEATTKATAWAFPELDPVEVYAVWVCTGEWDEEIQRNCDNAETYDAIPRLVRLGYIDRIEIPEDHWMRRDHGIHVTHITTAKGKATLDRMGFESDRMAAAAS